ncbi:MAG TPA: LPS assembly protein LptD [Methylomirabilota bacterium]|nr:LPS assembly protein LptD [Methylomirabilota bacterium]
MPLRRLALLAAGLLLTGVALAHAQAPPPSSVVVPAPGGEVTVVADRIEQLEGGNLLIATGNVEITRGAARLLADRVELDRETGAAVALGRVVFYDGENQLTGRRIDYNLKTGTGVVYDADARAAPYYRLSGERLERLGESVYRVRRGSFTTCEDDPPAWSFHFGEATADLEDFVYGTNASFWIRNVPLIPFFPFFAAAIRRERQTGFLFPRVGTSSRKGFFTEVPFYWAISDSQDLTVAVNVFARRGFGGSGEYRYVVSTEQRGRASGFLVQETQRHGATRGVGSVFHEWQIGPRLALKADVNAVTDDEILREYGDRLQQRSSQRVESNVFLTRSWDAWNFVADLFWYQDLTTRRPVELRRLPDLGLQAVRQPVPGVPGLLFEADTSLVRFVRDVGSDGTRVDLHPRLSRPLSAGGLVTVTPFVGGRLTGYDRTAVGTRLTHGGIPVETTEDEARVRRLVEAGTDVETRLSRVYAVDGGGVDALLHSVEPRVTYTWITGTDQDRLPIWTDGVDRIPETSRIEYSLTNRFRARTAPVAGADPVRWEAARLVLAHSYDERRGDLGDVISTLILQPREEIRLRSDVAYSVRGHGVQTAVNDVSVIVAPVTAAVGTRYVSDGNVSFLAAALGYDVSRLLSVRGTTNWDLRADSFVENRLALDLRFQCWALTLEWVNRARTEDEVRFAVNLLGVGGPVRTSVGVGALETLGQR